MVFLYSHSVSLSQIPMPIQIQIDHISFVDQKNPKHTGPCRYALRISLPKPYHQVWAHHTVFNGKTGGGGLVSLKTGTQNSLASDTPVIISLFLYRNNEYKEDCQYKSSEAHITISDLLTKTTVTFYDLNNTGQLIMTYNIKSDDGLQLTKARGAFVLKFPPLMKQSEIDGGLEPSGAVARDFRRTHVPAFDGREVPVWMLQAGICERLEEGQVDPISDDYINHALFHTTKWRGYSSTEKWAAEDFRKNHKALSVLGEFLGWYPWQSRYLYDQTYSNVEHQFKPTEQFSVLRDKTDVSRWAGDCEDFSKDMSLMFSALRRRNASKYPDGSPMRQIADMARQYLCLIVDTSINNEDKHLPKTSENDDPNRVELHMYVLLIPWAKVAELLRKGGDGDWVDENITDVQIKESMGLPVLSCESTELSITYWSLDTKPIDAFTKHIPYMRNSSDGQTRGSWSKMKVHVTGTAYKDDDFYRTLLCGYSEELYQRFGIHSVLFCNIQKGTHGIDNSAMMNFDESKADGTVAMKILGVAEPEDHETVQRLTDQLPCLHPIVYTRDPRNDTKIEYIVGDHVQRMFVRECDWTDEDHKRFCDSVNKSGLYKIHSCGKQVIELMDDMKIGMYQIIPSGHGKQLETEVKTSPWAVYTGAPKTEKETSTATFTLPSSSQMIRRVIEVSDHQPFDVVVDLPDSSSVAEWRVTGLVKLVNQQSKAKQLIYTFIADGPGTLILHLGKPSRQSFKKPRMTFVVEIDHSV